MKNKKAMSEVVTTVIMIVLALVAVGVIWSIIMGLMEGKAQQVAITQKCLDVKLQVLGVICATPDCSIVLKSTGKEFDGLKFVFKGVVDPPSNVLDVEGAIEQLSTKTVPLNDASIPSDANKVEVTPYFIDESGVKQYCTPLIEFNF
jgi:flagellin-like protein